MWGILHRTYVWGSELIGKSGIISNAPLQIHRTDCKNKVHTPHKYHDPCFVFSATIMEDLCVLNTTLYSALPSFKGFLLVPSLHSSLCSVMSFSSSMMDKAVVSGSEMGEDAVEAPGVGLRSTSLRA